VSEDAKTQRLYNEISGNSGTMAGILSINELTKKELARPHNNKNNVQEYVDHFSHMADFAGSIKGPGAAYDFGAAIKK